MNGVGVLMKKLRSAMFAAACAVAVISAVTYVDAQRGAGGRGGAGRGAGAPAEARGLRHLVYIATPGDNGTDNQSGIVVLDADKDYSFIKRISYGLPAS